MAGRYTGSYLDRSYGWRAIAILADIGQSFTRRMHPHHINYDFASAAATSLLDAHERGLGPFRLPLRRVNRTGCLNRYMSQMCQ